ncbi:Gfo/Idh/MocA family protein [Paenibacillus albus]|uniref:Gfo/Idh/MocA family oxidoreductase n=1 Tax=Paenibacillus albus TaxID=2495582 RepID=A0A3S9AAY8_9BACL|nr:Gfo/Idh/MocA family oxidoreductase [Paenibacillus albus]AZN42903.1 Gfo/Idh/MocA family oxidoreductase [Paenibacillus albus]
MAMERDVHAEHGNGAASKPKRILVLGTEKLGEWSKRPYLEVAGVVDLYGEFERLPAEDRIWLDRYPVYADVDTALARSAAELAVIIVPNDCKNTIDAERKVLERGLDLVVQKLRLDSAEDVWELVQLSRRSGSGSGNGAKFIVGEFYRYLASIRTIKSLLQDPSVVGKVEYVVWSCTLPLTANAHNRWMSSYKHVTLEDLSYHHFGTLHYLLGFHPVTLYAQSYKPSWAKVGTLPIASMQAKTAEGYRLHYLTTWGSRAEPTDYLGDIRIEGERGTIELKSGRVFITGSDGVIREAELLPARYEGFFGIFDHLHDVWEGKDTRVDGSPYTIEQFEPVLRAMYSAVRSAETGEAVLL